uniref:Nucleosome assembly protein 1 like 1 n=1 Tax=Rhinopithecus roxellana TaxID=61622 RepID=A0A2K6NDF9_RHIRO
QTLTTCLARVVKRGIEAKLYEEVHNLERKYAVLYQPLFDKQFMIINAIYEPTEEECEWKPDEEDEISEELKEKMRKRMKKKKTPKGIPEFWLPVFKNVDLLSYMLQEHDEPILKHFKDTKVKFSDAGQPKSFVLEFHFEPSEYFTHEVLTKTCRMRLEPEPDNSDPFSFDGPEIMGCTGGQIDWKKGKNKQKHKVHGTIRTVTKTVSNDSFFNFLAPPEVPESGDLDDAAEAILAADFKIGHFLFTEDDDDEYGEEGEEADEEGVDEGDEGNDPDYDPKKDQNPAECKQQ